MTHDEAAEVVQNWKQARQDELDLVQRKLTATNLCLLDALKRAEKAEARLAELDDRPDC